MGIIVFFMIGCISGFVLFKRAFLHRSNEPFIPSYKVSVIIPARNEERNLPFLLDSLKKQTLSPYEIIVVDDFSSDKTAEIARQYGVKLVQNTELPDGWTGKNWAVWNGFKKSTGDVIVFLDADVRLAPCGLESLLKSREECGGVISVVPYHYTEKLYERLSLIPYIMGVFAFTSPFEQKNTHKSLYGSCIVTTREDYEKINGHHSVRDEVMDDMTLGKRFSQEGIDVQNFIGYGLVSFRMYPNGIKSEIQGFSKGAVLGMVNLSTPTVFLIALWAVGLLASGVMAPLLLVFNHPWLLPFLLGYIVYTLQMFYFIRYSGDYGIVMPLLHFISFIFFILIMAYSIYQVSFCGCVSWKGRQIMVRSRKSL
ncbi:MAG: glycosyltransferase family 2 protein [Clostridiales bacterium]|jgi:4,4'-diaponeurosporenoate glycosyltransferase|nr:glycosyltransferase family 2 protein [Clostridiales bacterium]